MNLKPNNNNKQNKHLNDQLLISANKNNHKNNNNNHVFVNGVYEGYYEQYGSKKYFRDIGIEFVDITKNMINDNDCNDIEEL